MAYLIHYGVPRRSGRYPYGSGENPRAAIKDGKMKREKAQNLSKAIQAHRQLSYERDLNERNKNQRVHQARRDWREGRITKDEFKDFRKQAARDKRADDILAKQKVVKRVNEQTKEQNTKDLRKIRDRAYTEIDNYALKRGARLVRDIGLGISLVGSGAAIANGATFLASLGYNVAPLVIGDTANILGGAGVGLAIDETIRRKTT